MPTELDALSAPLLVPPYLLPEWKGLCKLCAIYVSPLLHVYIWRSQSRLLSSWPSFPFVVVPDFWKLRSLDIGASIVAGKVSCSSCHVPSECTPMLAIVFESLLGLARDHGRSCTLC